VKDRLNQLLEELHAELGTAESLDDAAKQQLRDLAGEISAKVQSAETAVDEEETPLQTTVLEFETDHPRITGILGQIAEALSRLGI
jgi:hypothetical protein